MASKKKKSAERGKAGAAAQTKAERRNVKRRKPSLLVVDEPGRRHGELIRDRLFGSEGKKLANFRLAAIREHAAAVARQANVKPLRSGTSKWVQLGPTVIPNGLNVGATYNPPLPVARINATGRVTAIVVDPNSPATIYVATARGGVWKTLDGGATWSPKSDHEVSLALGALAMAPSDHNRLYAGTGEGNIFFYVTQRPDNVLNEDYHGVGVLRSSDGGNTWTNVGSDDLTGSAFYCISVNPTNPEVLFGATTRGLMRSLDGGATWTLMTGGLPNDVICSDVAYHPVNPGRAWCALWGAGVYRTDNADAATPTWNKLSSGLPARGMSRIALAVAPSNHDVVFAIIADVQGDLKVWAPRGLYRSTDGGNTWSTIAVAADIRVLGPYTLNVAVDVSTPDVVYVSGLSLYRFVQNGGTWSVSDIGKNIHADNHAFASHPTNNLQIYAGNDAGIYLSADGGSRWDDTINVGLVITQFEFIGQHPTSDAQIIGGTQDNGTAMFRNNLVFYHSADGDGGQAGIDPANPNNVIHTDHFTLQKPFIERSTSAGKFMTYTQNISAGLTGPGSRALFYAPWTYDDTNSNNLAFGMDELRLSAAQGTDQWPTRIPLPDIGNGLVSAIHYVNSSLIYCGTSNGHVYKAVKSGGAWTVTRIGAQPLPGRWIWDIFRMPGTSEVLVLAVAGYQTGHVWKGTFSGSAWTWVDLSGTASNPLPDAPANALQIDPTAPDTIYVGTDVGVWMTTDAGTNWYPFNDGLPHCAVYDLKLHAPTRLLRAAMHGRGLWERKLDGPHDPDVRILVRDHVMDTGRVTPSPSGLPSAWEDPYRQINLADPLFWWNCADVKIDSPLVGAYQKPDVASVDYLAFETALEHRNPQRGVVNRVYVQVHNRGVVPARDVVVKILYADAMPGLVDLPVDFWTVFPADSPLPSPWTPIGAAQTIQALRPERPAVLEWDWTLPVSAAMHSCLLVVTSCSADPPATKSLAIDELVRQNRHVGLKNLHIVDALSSTDWGTIQLRAHSASDVFRFTPLPKGWSLRLVIPKSVRRSAIRCTGLAAKPISAAEHKRLCKLLGDHASHYAMKQLLACASRQGCTITGIPPAAEGIPLLVSFAAGKLPSTGSVHLIQESDEQRVVGGNTFVLRSVNARSA